MRGNWGVESINIPVIEQIGSTTANGTTTSIFDDPSQNILVDGYVPEYPIIIGDSNSVFDFLKNTDTYPITLTVNADMLTVDGGYPDNDISSLLYLAELWVADPETGFLPRNHYGNRVTIIPV